MRNHLLPWLCAGAFWDWNNINSIDDDFDKITETINDGYTGYEERKKIMTNALMCSYVTKKINNLVKKLLVLLCILILSVNLPITIKANTSKNHINYEIKTKTYERHPDKEVRVEFAKITGYYHKAAIKNMNYILEKEAFRIATNFIMTDEKLNTTESILHALNGVKRQEIYVWYEVLYKDENILSIKCCGETTHYTKKNESTLCAVYYSYIVFDLKTGKRLKLSDYVTLDNRIVDYKAKNYKEPDYASAAMILYYSFVDAFSVYDKVKDKNHYWMTKEEALENLKDGSIQWAVKKNKALFLINYISDDSWIEIPYSYIKSFAHY